MTVLKKHPKHPAKITRLKKVKARKHRLHVPPGGAAGPGAGVTSMSAAMVTRLFWRAGFGPTAADITAWTGKSLDDAAEAILSKPTGALTGPEPLNADGKPLDPKNDNNDLVLQWLDRMVRTDNPTVERLAFFWHRHFGNSADVVNPPQLLIKHIDLLRKYSDFATNPDATFPKFAYDVSTDPSMLRFLDGEQNRKGGPNENYAREVMELFAIGVFDDAGKSNYSENDVKSLAKAFTGWTINEVDPDNATAVFTESQRFVGPKSIFGKLADYKMDTGVQLVVDHPNHATFLARKIWGEFMPKDPTPQQVADLAKVYATGGRKLKPLLKAVLTNPAIFESIDEPNMLKPPVVYAVGVMRSLGLGINGTAILGYLGGMGQIPYYPPSVAGWEGGLAWMNTNTALERFGLVSSLIGSAPADSPAKIKDVPGETAQAAFDRAYAAVGSPWLAAGTRASLLDYANRTPAKKAGDGINRQLMLRSLILAGPDAQVM